jgi:hypothetical protein
MTNVPLPSLGEILGALNKARALLERLRRREAGVVEAEASAFPMSLNLRNFRPGDEISVVATGWYDDGALRPVLVHTTVEWDGDVHVLTLRPYDAGGNPLGGGPLVHVSWHAMV